MKYLSLTLLLIAFPSHGWNGLNSDLALLDTAVRHTWSGGYWQNKEQEGFYRFIVAGGGHENFRTKLYVQWIENGTHSELPKIISTTEIKELNETPVYSFKLPKCVGGWECNIVELEASHVYMRTEYKLKITFEGVGEYDLDQTAL